MVRCALVNGEIDIAQAAKDADASVIADGLEDAAKLLDVNHNVLQARLRIAAQKLRDMNEALEALDYKV